MSYENINLGEFELITNRLIMTADLNAAGKLFGGRLMAWMDEAAALYCMTKMGTRQIVTKKISEVIFNEPAMLGDVLEFRCRIKTVGNTSLLVECIVATKQIEDSGNSERIITSCELVFVALDRNGRPVPHRLAAATAKSNKNSKPKS